MIDVSASANYIGDCRVLLAQLPEGSVQTCVTSPPYFGLRDYGHEGQIGLEATPELFVETLVDVFRGVRRALRDDGTLWLNLGDSYAGSRARPQGETGLFNDREVAHQRIGREPDGTRPAPRAMARRAEQRPAADSPYKNLRRGSIGEIKHKDLIGIPWMLAFALRADGWYLRSEIIWAKPNPMPESVTDRPTKSHEQIFLLSKSSSYFYDADAIREPLADKTFTTFGSKRRSKGGGYLVATDNWSRDVPDRKPKLDEDGNIAGANKRSVWTVATQPYDGAHFATFPPKLIEPCILAGSRPGDLVLDPFFGSGTTGAVAEKHGRRWIGFDLDYDALAKERTAQRTLPMGPT